VTHASSSNSFTLFLPLCPAPPPPFLDDIVQERDAWSRRPAASPSTTARARAAGGGVRGPRQSRRDAADRSCMTESRAHWRTDSQSCQLPLHRDQVCVI
jgi:hypothetical protein